MFIKICGLTTEAAITAAVHAGADAVGFVFAASPRQVTAARARELCRGLPPDVQRVAVMKNPRPDEWRAVAATFAPDWLQTEAADFAILALGAVGRLPVYRDVPVLDAEALAAEQIALFEGAESGHGVQPDWHRAAEYAQRTRLILSGGLTPENVAEAIRSVRPWGVDVSSGVESRRGVKDVGRIAAFVAAAREAEPPEGE